MPILVAERRVTLEFSDLEKRIQLIGRPSRPPSRSSGVHQSGVLAYIARQIGILRPDEKDEEEYPLIWAMGQMWEEYIFSFYLEIDWQPGERTVDAVTVTTDGLSLDDKCEFDSVPWDAPELMNEEAKATFKGVATGEEFVKGQKWWMYRMQGAAACHVYGPRLSRWHVFHVRGDYKTFGPVYMQYVLRYSDKEVKQAWAMIQQNKHNAIPEAS
jgi:hypothetical protein